MIQVQGLRKLYDDYLAVDGVSFSLSPGQICGMVGPNGAGKTTTMRCLAGLIPATEGQLHVAGCELAGFAKSSDLIELKRRLAFVPDDPPLFDDLGVAEHLDLIGKIYAVENRREKGDELLRQFDLTSKRNARVSTLSRGMRQKLAVACAYVYDPEILLLDEPLTGLDPPGIRALLDSVRARAAAGATIIISSHLLAMIEDVVTDLLVMQQGRVRYFGKADMLRNRFPQSRSLEAAYFEATSPDGEPVESPIDSLPLPGLSHCGAT